MKKYLFLLTLPLLLLVMASCDDDATIVSRNISKAADNFEVVRRIVFINAITDNYLLEVIGKCNIEVNPKDRKLSVTCRSDKSTYKKHYLGLSDNVTWVVEQLDGLDVNRLYYRVTFKPQSILREIDLRGGLK